MKDNEGVVLGWVLLEEGGYAERDSEPGGAVQRGITQELYQAYCRLTKRPVPADGDFTALKAMTDEDTRAVYHAMILGPLQFDRLPAGIDYSILDFAVNSGLAGSLNAIRRGFALPVPRRSWVIDDELTHVLDAGDPGTVIDRINDKRLDVMKASKSWEWAQRGWVPRVKRVRERSKVLAGIEEEVSPAEPPHHDLIGAKAIPSKGRRI